MQFNLLLIILILSFGTYGQSITTDSSNVRVYKWINAPHTPVDKLQFDEYNAMNGPVRYITEYVTDEQDSIKRKVRYVTYDLQGRISLLRFYWANNHPSQELKEYVDAEDYYWQSIFVYKRNKFKEEIKFRMEDDSTIFLLEKSPLAESMPNHGRPKIVEKNRKTGEVLRYSRNNIGGKDDSWEIVVCEYDNFGRKTKEIAQDSTGTVISTNKIEYFNSEVVVQSYSAFKNRTIRYKLDNYGNWIKRTVTDVRNPSKVKSINKRIIVYY